MTTFNGELYLEEQLQSIINQTYTEWRLIINDDGSQDRTISIIEKYMHEDSRILGVHKNDRPRGAYNNYFSLIDYAKKKYESKFGYYFYCDQDDIWMKDKIEREISVLSFRKMAVCYSDVEFINYEGKKIGLRASQLRKMNVGNKYDFLFVFRYMLGTSMAHDKEIWNMIQIPPIFEKNEIKHDQYIRKIGALLGEIVYIPEPLVMYRRHANNVSKNIEQYNAISAVKKGICNFSSIISNTADHFYEAEILIAKIPDVNEVISDYRKAIHFNGKYACKFLKKYKISISDNYFEKGVYKLLFVSGIYKLSKEYKRLHGLL